MKRIEIWKGSENKHEGDLFANSYVLRLISLLLMTFPYYLNIFLFSLTPINFRAKCKKDFINPKMKNRKVRE